MPIEQTYVSAGPDEPAILAAFGLTAQALLGSGGEARIFDKAKLARVAEFDPDYLYLDGGPWAEPQD